MQSNPETTLRLLVAIASYGSKNIALLRSTIEAYRRLPLAVDIVVLSNEPKDLGPGIEVAVGLPIANPWSLPFAHKAIFAERVDQYDLFIYSEDDIVVTAANVEAFLAAQALLPPDEIAGFLRYEVDKTGQRWLPDMHGVFHWDPGSVRRRGDALFAQFSNEHAAFFILSRDQLKKAIESGGFLRAPYEGRHDMLCAAATDPYTSCGMRKVICISALESFLIHHASNRYAGLMGLPLADALRQIETLTAIEAGTHPAATLCRVDSGLSRGWWSKGLYEPASQELLNLIPTGAAEILSIGCGWGALEAKLIDRGARVTALPLDSVIGLEAARRGIEVVNGSLTEGLDALLGRRFDCIVVTNLVHLVDNPKEFVRRAAGLLAPGAALVLHGPNFSTARMLAKRALGRSALRPYSKAENFGVHILGPGDLKRSLRAAGLTTGASRWLSGPERSSVRYGRLAPKTGPSWRAVPMMPLVTRTPAYPHRHGPNRAARRVTPALVDAPTIASEGWLAPAIDPTGDRRLSAKPRAPSSSLKTERNAGPGKAQGQRTALARSSPEVAPTPSGPPPAGGAAVPANAAVMTASTVSPQAVQFRMRRDLAKAARRIA